MQNSNADYLDRRVAVPALVGDPSDFLIVAGLAGVGKDIAHHTQESPNTFVFGGAMSGPTMTGLGLALAQPDRRVLVATGDGDLLMTLGSLATIGIVRPKNLAVLCIDNELYGETGSQATHTSYGVDLPAVATACGFREVRTLTKAEELADGSRFLREVEGPIFVTLKVNGGPPPAYRRNWHGDETKVAFRRHLLGHR